ncbi:PilT/PilU family type 4a pilus ATPase [Thermochromatium tepidum]|uniref:PilT/PilU family type 4a pilus ATPase n=1 Tax=Thermochromatium tepidum ATCC 43061 TaxID=316276 RepID=A0A6I6EB47_THETI|nr:PilT/PilU family type 4a pilus ATPase [Thermochromatium tepidum]QGU33858.1 PilT/PilU family type 4a pilus ATPase [Thermochromatium tepidum ATCC 43061]
MDLKRALEQLLQAMVEKKGSDLFITAGWPPSIKIDGTLYPATKQPLTAEQSRAMVYELMNERQRAEFEDTKECQFAISRPSLGRFRVSAFVQRDSPGMVLRRIETRIPTLEELKLPSILRDLAMIKRGLVIFVGATGTGKSTSLAALISYRNHHSSGHIITVEDPIEYLHEHDGCIITQREVGVDTESFEVALRNTLRQAPDVILIGEIRTRQTMEYAITFAETGHLVLATLHANNANQAMDRIINFFPEESRAQMLLDLSLNLKGIIAQQLVPRKNGQGRRAVVEILLNTPLAADLIRAGEVHKLKDLMKRSGEQGMITFDQALFNLYQEGEISYEDALKYADSANEVRLMIKLQGGLGAGGEVDEAIEGMQLVRDEDPRSKR